MNNEPIKLHLLSAHKRGRTLSVKIAKMKYSFSGEPVPIPYTGLIYENFTITRKGIPILFWCVNSTHAQEGVYMIELPPRKHCTNIEISIKDYIDEDMGWGLKPAMIIETKNNQ